MRLIVITSSINYSVYCLSWEVHRALQLLVNVVLYYLVWTQIIMFKITVQNFAVVLHSKDLQSSVFSGNLVGQCTYVTNGASSYKIVSLSVCHKAFTIHFLNYMVFIILSHLHSLHDSISTECYSAVSLSCFEA